MARLAVRFQVRAQCMEDDRPVCWAATYWGVPCPDTDVTDTRDIAAADEVRRFRGATIPGMTFARDHFRDVKLHEGLSRTCAMLTSTAMGEHWPVSGSVVMSSGSARTG